MASKWTKLIFKWLKALVCVCVHNLLKDSVWEVRCNFFVVAYIPLTIGLIVLRLKYALVTLSFAVIFYYMNQFLLTKLGYYYGSWSERHCVRALTRVGVWKSTTLPRANLSPSRPTCAVWHSRESKRGTETVGTDQSKGLITYIRPIFWESGSSLNYSWLQIFVDGSYLAMTTSPQNSICLVSCLW